MSAKHTPGPWGENWHKSLGAVVIRNPRNSHVATVYSLQDAHLIAAAPELLHTLLMVREAAIDMRGENFNLTTEQWAAFHAAIAKATGSEA